MWLIVNKPSNSLNLLSSRSILLTLYLAELLLRPQTWMLVTLGNVDTCVSVVRTMHARSLTKVFEMFKTEKGKQIIRSGWRGQVS